MTDSRCFIVIGAGQAGAWIAKTLRSEKFEGRILLVGDEPYLPYERPPLSKAALLGEVEAESCFFWQEQIYRDLNIEVLPGRKVTAINRSSKHVSLDGGEILKYDKVAIATGARPRLLATDGATLPGIHYLRNMDDMLAIRSDLTAQDPSVNVLIVGGGWIGLEVAATLSKLGLNPVVVESADRLCARVVTPAISQWMMKLHQDNDVSIKLGVGVEEFLGNGQIERALLTNGEQIECTLAIVGIGVLANVELAVAARLSVGDGIIVDSFCRTSDPDIFAAGDVAFHPNSLLARNVRLESWENAQNQGIAAAKSMLDQGEAYSEVPWFWSDQYDANIQMIGMPESWEEVATRESPVETSFINMYLKGGMIIGAISVNRPRELRLAKRLMQRRTRVSSDELNNPDVNLQALLKK